MWSYLNTSNNVGAFKDTFYRDILQTMFLWNAKSTLNYPKCTVTPTTQNIQTIAQLSTIVYLLVMVNSRFKIMLSVKTLVLPKKQGRSFIPYDIETITFSGAFFSVAMYTQAQTQARSLNMNFSGRKKQARYRNTLNRRFKLFMSMVDWY